MREEVQLLMNKPINRKFVFSPLNAQLNEIVFAYLSMHKDQNLFCLIEDVLGPALGELEDMHTLITPRNLYEEEKNNTTS